MPEPSVADASHPHPLSEATSPMGRGLIPGPTAFLVPCLHEVFSIRPVMSAEAKFMLAGQRSIASKVGPECVHKRRAEAGVSVLHERAAQLTILLLPTVTPRGQIFSLDNWEVKQAGGDEGRKAGAATAKSPEEMDIEDAFNLFDQFKTLTPSKVAALPTPVRIGIARAREEERLREEEEEREAAEGERRREEEKRAREMEEERRINAELQELRAREEAQRWEERRQEEERKEKDRAEREVRERVAREEAERMRREEEEERRRKASEDLAKAERQAAARSAAVAAAAASHPPPSPDSLVAGGHGSSIRWDEERKEEEESMRRLAEGRKNQVLSMLTIHPFLHPFLHPSIHPPLPPSPTPSLYTQISEPTSSLIFWLQDCLLFLASMAHNVASHLFCVSIIFSLLCVWQRASEEEERRRIEAEFEASANAKAASSNGHSNNHTSALKPLPPRQSPRGWGISKPPVSPPAGEVQERPKTSPPPLAPPGEGHRVSRLHPSASSPPQSVSGDDRGLNSPRASPSSSSQVPKLLLGSINGAEESRAFPPAPPPRNTSASPRGGRSGSPGVVWLSSAGGSLPVTPVSPRSTTNRNNSSSPPSQVTR